MGINRAGSQFGRLDALFICGSLSVTVKTKTEPLLRNRESNFGTKMSG